MTTAYRSDLICTVYETASQLGSQSIGGYGLEGGFMPQRQIVVCNTVYWGGRRHRRRDRRVQNCGREGDAAPVLSSPSAEA
jgi:hypothetical protein